MTRGVAAALLACAALLLQSVAHAEPYLAVQNGYQCVQCHVNPTGGGMRNDFGLVFAKTLLPMKPLSEKLPDWNGTVGQYLRLGADYRGSWTDTDVSGQPSQTETGTDQLRAYVQLSAWQNRVSVYLDEWLAPGDATEQEFYLRVGDPASGWYAKGGKFYLPFGWRLQDSTSFVRSASGISMTTPATEGAELGVERATWSAQLDVTAIAGNEDTDFGDQLTAQFLWHSSATWRLGGAASLVDSDLGDRSLLGLFGGLRSGKFGWLGEADLVRDEGFATGARTQLALLGEVNWAFSKGQNLKLTAEMLDADRDVAEDQQTRWSVVYELSPWPFVQLRLGWRNYDGIPQNPSQNRSFTFAELHGYL